MARKSARTIRAAAQKANKARANSLSRVTANLTKEERAALNKAEGQAATELANDPTAKELYENMLKLSTLDKGERDAVMEHLREVAEENLEPFFEAERQELLTDVRFAMETISQKFGEFNEDTKREFGQAVEKLDRQSAAELRDTLVSVNQRGLLDSGMLAILAQRVIDDEEFSARQLKEDLDADLRFSAEKQALAEKEVDIKEDKALRDISQERDEAVESQATREAGRLELQEILTAIQDGVADIDPATGDFRFKPQEEPAIVQPVRAEPPQLGTPQREPSRDISTFRNRSNITQPRVRDISQDQAATQRTRLEEQAEDPNDIRSRAAQRGLARLSRRTQS